MAIVSLMYVSIPLWFSLNVNLTPHAIVVSIVSIPLWFSLNIVLLRAFQSPKTSFHPTMVLAQPRNGQGVVPEEFVFPSHYGSRSTRVRTMSEAFKVKFPSHYGSRSTLFLPLSLFLVFLFPSHYGSRSTRRSYFGVRGI